MRIGIYTRYAHCDEAYLAIRLAGFVRQQGAVHSLYATNPPTKLGVEFDGDVHDKRHLLFTNWAKEQDVIVWTHTPKVEQLLYAKRFGITTIVAPMWQELEKPFRKALRQADHLVAMTAECRELFTTVYKFKHVTHIPFDTGLPAVKKTQPVDVKAIKILLPWFDRNARCANSQFLGDLAYIITRMPDARLTVGVTSSRFAPSVAQFFKELGRKTGGRVKLRRSVAINQRPGLYTEHDLTLIPAECDNYGMCGITSITCGTPVLSFNLSPQSDFIYQDSNGVLVKTRVDYDENGVPHAAPNYEKLMAALQTFIAEPWHIDNLNKRVNYNLAARRKAFELGWQTILRLV